MRCRRPLILTSVVTVAGLSVLAAGCGGGGSPGAGVATLGTTTAAAAAATGGSSPGGSLAEYARCIRSHGVLSFPDPASLGSSSAIKAGKSQMARISESKTSSAAVRAAQRACVKYAPPTLSPPHVSAQEMQKLLAVSRCMRAHGIQNFPDPNPSSGELAAPAGISKNSPQVLAALRACRSLGQAAGLGPPSTGP